MDIILKYTAELNNDPSNVRLHNEKNISVIKSSLAKFGQQKPIVIDDKGIVIAGNGTLEAARELGWEKIKCVVTELDETNKTAFAIADNRTSELAEWDYEALDLQIEKLKSLDFNIEDIGFSMDSVDSSSLNPIVDDQKEFDESIKDSVEMIKCPHCGGEFPK